MVGVIGITRNVQLIQLSWIKPIKTLAEVRDMVRHGLDELINLLLHLGNVGCARCRIDHRIEI